MLIAGGRSWHPFINLSKSKEAEMDFLMLCVKPCMFTIMGENRFSLLSYHIGNVFSSIQLSFDIYRVSNRHDIHQMIGGLHNLYKFQWAITSCLSYYTSNIGLRTPRHACHLVFANMTFQYLQLPSEILQFPSICNGNVLLFTVFGGGLPLDVLSILQAACHML